MWCARFLPQVYRKDTSLCPNNLRFRRQFHFRRVGYRRVVHAVTDERIEAMHAEKWLNWHTLSLQLCQTVTLAPYIPSDDRNRYNALFSPIPALQKSVLCDGHICRISKLELVWPFMSGTELEIHDPQFPLLTSTPTHLHHHSLPPHSLPLASYCQLMSSK